MKEHLEVFEEEQEPNRVNLINFLVIPVIYRFDVLTLLAFQILSMSQVQSENYVIVQQLVCIIRVLINRSMRVCEYD